MRIAVTIDATLPNGKKWTRDRIDNFLEQLEFQLADIAIEVDDELAVLLSVESIREAR